jgi:hypothetical protein
MSPPIKGCSLLQPQFSSARIHWKVSLISLALRKPLKLEMMDRTMVAKQEP